MQFSVSALLALCAATTIHAAGYFVSFKLPLDPETATVSNEILMPWKEFKPVNDPGLFSNLAFNSKHNGFYLKKFGVPSNFKFSLYQTVNGGPAVAYQSDAIDCWPATKDRGYRCNTMVFKNKRKAAFQIGADKDGTVITGINDVPDGKIREHKYKAKFEVQVPTDGTALYTVKDTFKGRNWNGPTRVKLEGSTVDTGTRDVKVHMEGNDDIDMMKLKFRIMLAVCIVAQQTKAKSVADAGTVAVSAAGIGTGTGA